MDNVFCWVFCGLDYTCVWRFLFVHNYSSCACGGDDIDPHFLLFFHLLPFFFFLIFFSTSAKFIARQAVLRSSSSGSLSFTLVHAMSFIITVNTSLLWFTVEITTQREETGNQKLERLISYSYWREYQNPKSHMKFIACIAIDTAASLTQGQNG